MKPALPRRGTLLTLLLAALAASPAATQVAAGLVAGEGARTLFLGTDRDLPRETFNAVYLDSDGAPPTCATSGTLPLPSTVGAHCYANLTEARAVARAAANGLGDYESNAGIALRYVLTRRCAGQTAPQTFPMQLTWTFDHASVHQTAGRGRGSITWFAYPYQGPQHDAILSSGPYAFAGYGPSGENESITIASNPPLDQVSTAVLYPHATASGTLPGDLAVAQGDLRLRSMRVEWDQLQGPALTGPSYTKPAGSPPHSENSGDGYRWYHSPFNVTLQARDALSCAKEYHYKENGETEYRRQSSTTSPDPLNSTTNEDPLVLVKSAEGKWHVSWTATNWQGVTTKPDREIKVGADWTPPTANAIVNGAPNAAGWFNAAPTVEITCSDAVSGCWKIEWNTTLDPGSFATADRLVASVLKEGEQTFRCRVADRAQLWTDRLPFSIRLDRSAPAPKAYCTPQREGAARAECNRGNLWYNRNVTVDLACVDAVSSCSVRQYRVDGGAWTSYEGPFRIEGEGPHKLEVTGEDLAGNPGTGAYDVNVDWTPPTTLTIRETRGNGAPVNDTPAWKYTTDESMSGALFWETARWADNTTTQSDAWHGNDYAQVAPDPWTILDGNNCVNATVMDRAGNLGPGPVMHCTLVDKVDPVVNATKPLIGKAYINDEELPLSAGTQTIALGNITITSTAKDEPRTGASYKSGLQSHRTLRDLADWQPHQSTYDCPAAEPDCLRNVCDLDGTVCAHTWAPTWEDLAPLGYRKVNLAVRATDGAGNDGTATTEVRMVSLLTISGSDSLLTQTRSFWLPYTGAKTFVRFELYRSEELPSGGQSAWVLRERFTSPQATSYTDSTVVADRTYVYKIVLVTRDGDAPETTQSSNTYEARYRTGGNSGCNGPLDRATSNTETAFDSKYTRGLCDAQLAEMRMESVE